MDPPSLPPSVSSSGKVVNTKDEMKDMSYLVKISHRLLAKYDRRELTDRLVIIAALIFFFTVVLYIIKKRLFGWIW